ncbi:MAG: diguanylate cyclase [Pirellulaceae bacterium]
MPTNRTPAGSAQLHPSGIGDGEGDSRLNSGTVLVVDDESINRKLLTSMLERHGYCAMEACDGDDALEWVRSGKCDLILLDIQMPDRDGFELLAEIRKHRDRTQLPIIIVTANNSTVDIVRAFQCGANDYVSKPIDVDVILARINTHISLQKAQAALRESEERYAVVARGTNDGLWDWNLATNRVYYSPRWLEMLGLENVDMTDSPDEWFSRVHHEDLPRVEAELQMHRVGKTAKFETELRMQHSDGQFRWMLCRGIAIHNGGRNAVRIAGSLTDITEGKVADALTGLPNRLLFMDRVERAVHRAQREVNYKFAVLYLDLDNFKLVNDSLGHDFGDDLLVSVARRIENCVRMSETIVARLGGDEFAILMERAAGVEDAVAVANRIIAALSRPFTFHGRDVFSGASVGIALGERGKRKADELLREADTAMFQAKSEGRGKLRVFDPEM